MHITTHPYRARPAILRILAFALLVATAGARADEPDELDMVPGVVATFRRIGGDEPVATRIVPDLSAHWGDASPDPRLKPEAFAGRWTGYILIQSPGRHTFYVASDGPVTLKVAGRVVNNSFHAMRFVTIDLPAGFAPFALDYTHVKGPAFVSVGWSGPGFGGEPVPARVLFHATKERDDPFEVGRRLADRLGCANCHALLDMPRHPELGPTLADAGRSIAPRWLDDWLADPTRVRPRTRMPAFGRGLGRGEVADLAAFLGKIARAESPSAEVRMAMNVASPDRGMLLFRSLGCLACHARGAPEAPSDDEGRAAPDLDDLPRKRTVPWVAAYLEHPRSNKETSRHRADFRLNADESAHLASYLANAAEIATRPDGAPEGDAKRGETLADRLRCASCHALPGLKPRPADVPLTEGSRPDAGCLADRPGSPAVPRYSLNEAERSALRAFVARLPFRPTPIDPETKAEDLIRRRNCLACHARDGRGGATLGARVAALIARDPALGALKGTLTPPNLTAVGDKLRPDYLAEAVRGAATTARPWLSVRMPAFSFEPGEADAIVTSLRNRDAMPFGQGNGDGGPIEPDAPTLERGAQLIGQRGFGCLSCHVIAGRIPPGGEPETLGPDLALAHRRMTRRYFDRWIANPQRIIAGTPMPQFVQPVATAPGPLDAQLATIWQLLGSRRVAEVAASGTREILKRSGDRAMVVRDMVLLPGAPGTEYTPRGLAIGLKNDHALLFDTDRLTWLACWDRGFLSRTKSGRLWEWHPEGRRLRTATDRNAPVVLLDAENRVVPPREVRERFGTFDEIDFEGDGVRLSYRLHAPKAGFFSVEERIRPTADGWERAVVVRDVPPGFRPELIETPPRDAKGLSGMTGWVWRADSATVVLHLTPILSRAPDGSYRGLVQFSVR